ncbi:MAG: hypothetical protein KJ621_03885 [Proteobacteria bacterium]|nr:hypothetical protein [Pseudomonadota bacterium]
MSPEAKKRLGWIEFYLEGNFTDTCDLADLLETEKVEKLSPNLLGFLLSKDDKEPGVST